MGIHFEEIANLFPQIDYALLGIGAFKPEWFMADSHTSPSDALIAFQQLKAKQLIPMHHGTFDFSDEPIFYPLQQLREIAIAENITNILTLSIGSKYSF